jgi:hypothetical protein
MDKGKPVHDIEGIFLVQPFLTYRWFKFDVQSLEA